MEDELEDRIIYQSFISHMKLLSKVAVGLPMNVNQFGYIWRLLRTNLLKPEVLICSLFIFMILFYLQAVNFWSRALIGRLNFSLNKVTSSKSQKLQYVGNPNFIDIEKYSWELIESNIAAYAIQGRRPKMEDVFVINKDINKTGVSLFAVFDGHGGEFAANYARDHLIINLVNKVTELKRLIVDGFPKLSNYTPSAAVPPSPKPDTHANKDSGANKNSIEPKKSLKKAVSASVTDDCFDKYSEDGITDPQLLEKLCRGISRRVRTSLTDSDVIPTPPELSTYLSGKGIINYGRLLTDEVLHIDRLLVAAAKKTMNVAGTTALIAVIEDSQLFVANVGDSRGVMCDSKGNAIPLSFDHKPQLMREKKRIREAGGFIAFNGVWRVAGILATSRALGDYPLKEKKFVIANPDILTFDLSDHKPQFLVLASDGLWDTFTNEEVVAFIKDRLNEKHFGAKTLTLQAYLRGSLDNITVMVINLKDHNWASSSNTTQK